MEWCGPSVRRSVSCIINKNTLPLIPLLGFNDNHMYTGVMCGAPEAPQNGYIQIKNFTGSYEVGTTAVFECSQGYELEGEITR